MKILLTLLFSGLSISAATTYPVITDSANRTFPGGVTNVFFLNSNVVTTGTMRATGALTLTNSGNVFAGDGSGLTGVGAGISTSGGSATNLSVYSSGTTNRPLTVYGTNGGEFYIDKDGNTKARAIYFGTSGIADFGISPLGSGTALAVLNGTFGAINKPLTAQKLWATDQIAAGGTGLIGFYSAGGNPAQVGSLDSAIGRSSAGVIEVNTGTAGTYRDLVARSIYATNLYATNLIVNGGATVTKILSATASLNFDLTAVTVEDLTITVTGAADGDVVTLGVPNGSVTTSVQYSAWVSAADTVTVRARTSVVGENPASGTFRATIFKH